MSNTNNEIVRDLAVAAIGAQHFNLDVDYEGMILPEGMRVEMLDSFKAHPRFANADAEVFSVESFIMYVNQFKVDETAVFGNPNSSTPFTATIDYHGDQPGWGKHKLSLRVNKSPEWEAWELAEKNRFSQRDFLHFLEDNLSDIQEPEHAGLLEKIKRVNVSGSSSSTTTVDSASEENDSNNSVRVGDIPEMLTLALRPWKYAKHYAVKARVHAHIDGDRVSFSYQIVNAERALEQLFNEYRQSIEDGTSIKVFV